MAVAAGRRASCDGGDSLQNVRATHFWIWLFHLGFWVPSRAGVCTATRATVHTTTKDHAKDESTKLHTLGSCLSSLVPVSPQV